MDGEATFTIFDGERLVGHGPAAKAVAALDAHLARADTPQILVFADETGQLIEQAQLAWLAKEDEPAAVNGQARRPGRPRLGVVAREVTLLPRHWEWLGDQPGGASVALRKLVDQARRANEGEDRVRHAQDRSYRLMSALSGDRPHYEEALRALYATDGPRFTALIAGWPADIRAYVMAAAGPAFAPEGEPPTEH